MLLISHPLKPYTNCFRFLFSVRSVYLCHESTSNFDYEKLGYCPYLRRNYFLCRWKCQTSNFNFSFKHYFKPYKRYKFKQTIPATFNQLYILQRIKHFHCNLNSVVIVSLAVYERKLKIVAITRSEKFELLSKLAVIYAAMIVTRYIRILPCSLKS